MSEKFSHGETAKLLGADPVFYQGRINPTEEDIFYGYSGPGWYFYDETWSHQHGPYDTKAEADEACEEYASNL